MFSLLQNPSFVFSHFEIEHHPFLAIPISPFSPGDKRTPTVHVHFAVCTSPFGQIRIRPPFSPGDKRTPMSARAANLRLFGLVREALQIRFAVPTHNVTHLQLCTCSGGGHSSWDTLTLNHGELFRKILTFQISFKNITYSWIQGKHIILMPQIVVPTALLVFASIPMAATAASH